MPDVGFVLEFYCQKLQKLKFLALSLFWSIDSTNSKPAFSANFCNYGALRAEHILDWIQSFYFFCRKRIQRLDTWIWRFSSVLTLRLTGTAVAERQEILDAPFESWFWKLALRLQNNGKCGATRLESSVTERGATSETWSITWTADNRHPRDSPRDECDPGFSTRRLSDAFGVQILFWFVFNLIITEYCSWVEAIDGLSENDVIISNIVQFRRMEMSWECYWTNAKFVHLVRMIPGTHLVGGN